MLAALLLLVIALLLAVRFATIGLSIVGNALLPGIGGAIGAGIGAVLDQQIIFPALGIGKTEVPKPQIEDREVQTVSEGAPISYCLGPRSRVAGNVIWVGDLATVTTTQQSGGKGGLAGPSVTTTAYFRDVAVVVCEGPISRIVKIWADTSLIYEDGGAADSRYEDLRIYTGTTTQLPDSSIEAKEGAGTVPGYRGIAYVVFERLALADFGNRLPTLSFLVEAQAAPFSTQDAVRQLLIRAGLVEGTDFDVDNVDTVTTFGGAKWAGPTPVFQPLEAVSAYADLVARERNMMLEFADRGNAGTVTIAEDDLGASTSIRDTGTPSFEETDTPESDLPKEVLLEYVDSDSEYQAGSQRATLSDAVPDGDQQIIKLPVTMTGVEARAFALRRLYASRAEARLARFVVPVQYLCILPGDTVDVTYRGQDSRVLVTRVTRGANWLLEIEGVIVWRQATGATQSGSPLTQTGSADTSPVEVQAPTVAQQYAVRMLQLAPLTASEVSEGGAYWLVGPEALADPYLGGGLLESANDVSFAQVQTLIGHGVYGEADTLLPDAEAGAFDAVNTVDVTLVAGTLSSAADEEAVLAGQNFALLGDEVIAFRDVTSLGGTSYRLSHILRGRRDTGDATGTHAINERFALLDSSVVQFRPLGLSPLNSTLYYRAVSPGGDVTTANSDTLAPYTAQNLVPFSPTDDTFSFASNGDLTAGFRRRSRTPFRIFSGALAPNESPEAYEVDVLDAPGGSVVRTVTATATANGSVVVANGDGTGTLTYDAADQTADGFVAGNDVLALRIYQLSPTVGRGKALAVEADPGL